MCRWVAGWLLAWAESLLPTPVEPVGPYVVLTVPKDALFERACALATALDADDQAARDATGEWRHAQAFHKLHREFPSARWRDLRLVIEAAVRSVSA